MNNMSINPGANAGPLVKLEHALQQEAIGGKLKKESDFAEAYPIIEQHLARKVPVKVVIEKFGAAYGYVIHPPRFRKMLVAERKRREEAGEVAACSECGQHLVSASDVAETVGDTEDEQ